MNKPYQRSVSLINNKMDCYIPLFKHYKSFKTRTAETFLIKFSAVKFRIYFYMSYILMILISVS